MPSLAKHKIPAALDVVYIPLKKSLDQVSKGSFGLFLEEAVSPLIQPDILVTSEVGVAASFGKLNMLLT